ncbi:discoidin domain-containing protein [Pyxidicoccus sp. 3LFB2]
MRKFLGAGAGMALMGVLLLACGGAGDAPALEEGRESLALDPARQCTSVPCLPNLARSATVLVSSTTGTSPTQLDPRWTKERAVDGNRESVETSFGWSSAVSASEYGSQWIRFDFGTARYVNEVQLYARNDATYGTVLGDGFPRDFVIEVSQDGVGWSPVVSRVGHVVGEDEAQTFTFTRVLTRFVRVRATRFDAVGSAGYFVQLAEVELYDIPSQLTFTFTNSEQAVLTVDGGDVITKEDVYVAEATELDGLFVAYQAWLTATGTVNDTADEGGVSGLSFGINPSQRCKFWQVGCWSRKLTDPRWPNNTVFFDFAPGMSEWRRQAVRGHIADWNSRSSVQWVEDHRSPDKVRIKTRRFNGSCGMSAIGRLGGKQKLRIDPDCFDSRLRRAVHHEMGHATGLNHEHQRCDRDSYVSISGNDSNRRKECQAKYSILGPYDYSSVMHYTSGVVAVTPRPLGSVGNPAEGADRSTLGCHDRLGINKLYGVAGGPIPGSPGADTCNRALTATVTASSITGPSASQPDGRWTPVRVADGQRSSLSTSYGWSSMGASSPATAQWIRFQFPDDAALGGPPWLHRVDIYPRNDATYGTTVGDGFPVNFTIDVSADGVNWGPAVSRTNHPKPTGVQTFEFPSRPVRFLRIHATQLRQVSSAYYFQIAEVEVF